MLTMWETGLVFILGLAAPFLVRLATSFCQKRELYGSEAVLLNLEVQSLWNNMGYWEGPQDSFRDACRRLAVRVAHRVHLGKGDSVVDIGCGNGDSLALWVELGADRVQGVSSMASQVALADALLARANLAGVASVTCGDGAEWLSSQAVPPSSMDIVVSIDAAYEAGWLSTCLLRVVCFVSKVPWTNMVHEDEYVARLRRAGFADIEVEDVSARVFAPLATWIRDRDRMYGRAFGSEWGGLMGFARVLEWWSRGSVAFVVVSATKPAATKRSF